MFINHTITFSQQKGLTDSGAFGLFAGICMLMFVFTLTMLPETKGKSLEELENLFKPKRQGYEQIA